MPIEPRWIVGVIALLLVAVLMYSGTITTEIGVPIIVAILGALGLYERDQRKKAEE